MSKHNFNRNFAVIIGINNYQNGIKKLKTAAPDAFKLAEIIQKQHEILKPQYQPQNRYEVQLFLDQRASLSQLNQLIADFKQGQIPLDNEKVIVTKDDRLFFYYAGHGIALDALENQDGPVGYLIAQDSTLGRSSTYLPMQELHDALNALPCRHMLAILDCCFAGAFRWASLKREIVPKVKVYKERYDRFIRDRAWQVITSAADDQKALDSLGSRGIVREGNEVHSPFAKALFDALCREGADLNKDGIITATELYSYLRDRVEILTEKHYQRQTPSLCPLRKHDKGEFIFLSPEFDRDKLEDAPSLNVENNPYKGLQSYDEKDSNLFFGREEQIQKLFEKIVANKKPLTLVLGASGTGKSSLMKAGLLPRLRDYQENKFKILDPMRPGESPLKSLVQICLPIADTITSLELALYEQTLANIIERWNRNNPKTKILFPIDQFEELITLCKSDQEREQFQKLIRNAITKYPDKIHVVITLRLDFEALFQNSVLEELWNKDARFVVPLMTQNELREVIEKPALEKVVYFDPPSLVNELINEVVQMPGALPLLSFTLSELYLKYLEKRRDNRALTKEDYEELGRVAGSITKRANQELEKLVEHDSAYENTVRRIMLRMISLQGGELARRQVLKSELIYSDEEENKRVEKVIKNFSEARLIVEASNSQGEAYVEPSHDFLIQGWRLLKEQIYEINKNPENLSLQQRLILTADAYNWYKLNQKQKWEAYLWNNNPLLKILEKFVDSEDSWLNDVETKFVKKSIEKNQADWLQVQHIILRGKAAQVENLLRTIPVEGLLLAIQTAGENLALSERLPLQKNLNPAPSSLLNSVLSSLISAVQVAREENILTGHTEKVKSVAFSPDGKYIVSGSWDNTLRLWNRKGNPIGQPFKGHKNNIDAVSFSPDSKYIVSCSMDGTLLLWDLEGEQIAELFQDHRYAVSQFAFSSNGKYIIGYCSDHTLRWSDFKGEQIDITLPLQLPFKYVANNIALSPNGNYIVTSYEHLITDDNGYLITDIDDIFTDSNDNVTDSDDVFSDIDDSATDSDDFVYYEYFTLQIWNINAQLIALLQGHDDSIFSLAFSPDSKYIVSGSKDNTVRLWNLEGEQIGKSLREDSGGEVGLTHKVKPIGEHQRSVISVAFSPDGNFIVSGSMDNTLRLWNIEYSSDPWQVGESFLGHENQICSVAFSPDGKCIASSSNDQTVRLWDLEHQAAINKPFRGHNILVHSVAFSPNGKYIVSNDSDTVRLWDRQGELIDLIDFRPDSKNIVSDSYNFVPQVTFSPNGHEIDNDSYDFVNFVAFSPDGDFIIIEVVSRRESNIFEEERDIFDSMVNYSTVLFWDLKNQQITKPFKEDKGNITSVAFSPNGQYILNHFTDGRVRLWDWKGNFIAQPCEVHENKLTRFTVSLDGEYIASASQDKGGTVRLWNIKGQQIGKPFEAHKHGVSSIALSPDNKYIITASAEHPSIGGQVVDSESCVLKLWDFKGKQVGETFRGHQSGINSVAFSPDGNFIISGSGDNTIRLWDREGKTIMKLPNAHGKVPVISVAFSPDGKYIVSGGSDTVRLWRGPHWEPWLHAAYQRLRNHPILVKAETEIAKDVKKICQKYVGAAL